MSIRGYLYKYKSKLTYICKLIVNTPNYGWIILLQIISGFLSFAGLPLLIPVLDYMQEETVSANQDSNIQLLNTILNTFGIEANFYSILIIAFVLIMTGQCLSFLSTIVATYARIELSEEYRQDIFKAYASARWLWLVDNRSGEMNYAVIREADYASDAHLNAQRVLIYGTQVAVLILVTLQLSVPITCVAIGFYAFLTVINAINSKRVRHLADLYNQYCMKLSNELVVLQQNKKFFKTSLLNSKSLNSISTFLKDITGFSKKSSLRMELQQTWNFVLSIVFLVVMLLFYKQLALTYSELLLVFLIFTRIGPNFNMFSACFLRLDSQIPIHLSFNKRLNEFKEQLEPNGTQIYKEGTPINFHEVNFCYPNGTCVFNNLNVQIETNQTTAFIGSSGVGKSTLLDLILRLLEPTSGTIYYGDIPHDQLDKSSLRNKIAYVSQETTLIDGTLRDNLTVTAPNVSEEKIQEILQKVVLDKTVQELPQGLETPVGENGIKLSGGQRQRVALARALFMEPKILILDEATSSLDAKSELMIQETIGELKKDFTILIVTHKLSAVRFADKIYVLHEGQAIESGTYEELIAQKGQFYSFDSLQK